METDADWTFNVLARAGVIGSTRWKTPSESATVFLTRADQIVGPHFALLKFVSAFPDWYRAKKTGAGKAQSTWQSHHIVEEQDLKILRSCGHSIPHYRVCPAVLLPLEAHQNRINRVLGRGKLRLVADAETYQRAYDLVGDYTGAGERAIRNELLAIVKVIFNA